MRKLLVALLLAVFACSCGSDDSTERLEYIAFTLTRAFEKRDYELASRVCHPDLLASEEAALRAYVDKVLRGVARLGGPTAHGPRGAAPP